jgi:hypothetical protein
MIAAMLETSGVNQVLRRGIQWREEGREGQIPCGGIQVCCVQVITVDIHSPQTEGFFSVPVPSSYQSYTQTILKSQNTHIIHS